MDRTTPELNDRPDIALTIGGSDSGGGAGIQADLKTFLALQVHGCSAITCVTAQNTCGVSRVDALPPEALSAQIEAVLTDLPVAALKTGMLLNRSLIEATARALEPLTIPRLIDPVMVSRAGSVLLEPEAIEAYRQRLLPLADLITPNIHEARLLSGEVVQEVSDVEHAAERLLVMGPQAVLIKGGGLPGLRGRDYLLQRNGSGQWLTHAPGGNAPQPWQRLHPRRGDHRRAGEGAAPGGCCAGCENLRGKRFAHRRWPSGQAKAHCVTGTRCSNTHG